MNLMIVTYDLLLWSLSWHHGKFFLFEQTWQIDVKKMGVGCSEKKKIKNFNKYFFECYEWQNWI